jgi:hypothetical protein
MSVRAFELGVLDEVRHSELFWHHKCFFGTKQTPAANTGSIILFLSTTLNLSFRASHLSWSIGSVDLLSEGHSAVKSIATWAWGGLMERKWTKYTAQLLSLPLSSEMCEGCGLTVLPQEVVQTFPFHSWNSMLVRVDLWVWLLHLWCSQFSFDNEPLFKLFLSFPCFLSIRCSRP